MAEIHAKVEAEISARDSVPGDVSSIAEEWGEEAAAPTDTKEVAAIDMIIPGAVGSGGGDSKEEEAPRHRAIPPLPPPPPVPPPIPTPRTLATPPPRPPRPSHTARMPSSSRVPVAMRNPVSSVLRSATRRVVATPTSIVRRLPPPVLSPPDRSSPLDMPAEVRRDESVVILRSAADPASATAPGSRETSISIKREGDTLLPDVQPEGGDAEEKLDAWTAACADLCEKACCRFIGMLCMGLLGILTCGLCVCCISKKCPLSGPRTKACFIWFVICLLLASTALLGYMTYSLKNYGCEAVFDADKVNGTYVYMPRTGTSLTNTTVIKLADLQPLDVSDFNLQYNCFRLF